MHLWEKGWRVYGYWEGNTQLGRVGLSPPGFKPLTYLASINMTNFGGKLRNGFESCEFKHLHLAKRWVESKVAEIECINTI